MEQSLGELNRGDAELASRVAAGERSALEEAFNAYGGAVKSVASRVLRDEALAEDVVQDTFVGFWRAPEKYDPARGSLRSFLLTIAHRRAVDIVRSEVARARRESTPPDPGHYDLADEVAARDLSEEVRRALAALADGEREAISMAYFGGLSYVEVARRLGEPEGTVKSRIRSGMRKLATSLQGVGP
jgi:RNA polymerase sigma-70 factor (ECF subfamily)